ncbi:FCD domain-containing protein [Gordonia sp. N1V]|uniref:FadR/GntR family transcriptional regulator n=1 Tax=Gordonia sp. N1V TaxID=3034163 RepID=UPI0023E0F762|nr:FCD domain-containing protein [Gordonia sp. N1V]MDF3282608.1 FCD domain-containing protein [Gordonia sp. N1V]
MADDTTTGGSVVEPPDIPAYSHEVWHAPSTPVDLPGSAPGNLSRAEAAANRIALIAAGAGAGERIGSKDDIRKLCSVSVGTVNEAIKLALARGVISSRPGPGGGIFAKNPPPLSRMNGWFRAATEDRSALLESIQIRDALAPLLVDEVLSTITDADQREFASLAEVVRKSLRGTDVIEFVWAVWNVHEYFANIGGNQLLNSLYLSIMEVGTSHLRARLSADAGATDAPPLHLAGLAAVCLDLVDALAVGDASGAIDALRRTDPTMILRPPADDPTA